MSVDNSSGLPDHENKGTTICRNVRNFLTTTVSFQHRRENECFFFCEIYVISERMYSFINLNLNIYFFLSEQIIFLRFF